MRIVKKPVYYCDFCNKKSLAGWRVKRHEIHCTGNPNRICQLCEGVYNIPEITENIKSRFVLRDDVLTREKMLIWTGNPVTLEEVRKIVSNCPNCILTIIRLCKLNNEAFKGEFKDHFNYKEEKDLIFRKRTEDYMKENYFSLI